MPRSPRAIWRLIALLSLVLLVAAACGDDDGETTAGGGDTAPPAEKTYKIAFVGALTGDNANLGINIRNGAKLAADQAEGVKIELLEYDTKGAPEQASTVKDQFIADEEILGIVGPAFSGETRAVLPSLEEAGLVMISASATAVDIPATVPGGKVFHRIVPDDDVQGKSGGDYIAKKLQAKTAAYIHDNTEYGKPLAEGTQKAWEASGVQTVGSEAIDPNSEDYSAAVNSMKSLNPDVIYYGGYYSQAGKLAKQLTDGGVDATFVSGDGSLDPGFIEAGGDGTEGAQLSCACNLATEDSPGELGEFATAYKDANDDKEPGTYSSEGYDAANILIEGIKAGNTTREKLLDYVENLTSYDGISKTIAFEENGNVKGTDVFFFEVRDGKIELLGSTADLIPAG
jgi:branched-chain amino acid transport system substrate-binding protein